MQAVAAVETRAKEAEVEIADIARAGRWRFPRVQHQLVVAYATRGAKQPARSRWRHLRTRVINAALEKCFDTFASLSM